LSDVAEPWWRRDGLEFVGGELGIPLVESDAPLDLDAEGVLLPPVNEGTSSPS
jgi:hypothetical protein